MIELENYEFDQTHELTEVNSGMSAGSLWVGIPYQDYNNVITSVVSVHEMFSIAET